MLIDHTSSPRDSPSPTSLSCRRSPRAYHVDGRVRARVVMPGDGGGEVGRASHGLEACDFRHAGLRLEWGHEHSPDAFEVFALAVSRDGTKIAAGGACPSAPGVAHVRVWRLGDDDDDHTHAHAHPSARSHASRAAAASTRATLEAVLRAEGAVGCLSVALSPTGDAAFAGMADGSMWAWDLPSGALRYGGSDAETHPALAKLPRRRRRDRNPFLSAFSLASGPDPRPVRRLLAVPSSRAAAAAAGDALNLTPKPELALVAAVGGHGVFPVWDASTGYAPGWDARTPSAFHDDPAYHEDGACHLAASADGAVLYSTTVDAKALRAWELRNRDGGGAEGGGRGRCLWQSGRLAVRGVHLAGLASLPRPGGASVLATCAATMMQGTCYAEPDTPVRVSLVDARDGKEVRRFPLEGITACNRFVDCSSLAGGGGGTLLFLAHKDGSIWIHGAVNGAHVSTVHAHGQWTNTSGHHRLLPACVARTFDGEFLYAATTDGGCVHRYAVGAPATWSRASHVRFPAAFRRRVRELVLAVHACVARGGGGGGGGIDERERRFRLGVGAATTLAAGPSANGETGERGSRAPELWGEGFAAVASVEPGIVELVVARMARLEHGSESSEEPARSAWDPREGDG